MSVTDAAEITETDQRGVACDGDKGPLGHPRVYLRIVDHEIECPYCSRIFRLSADAGDDHGH